MMQRGYENRFQIEMISIEYLVPQEHLLRQISAAVDFSKIYEFVKELYCDDNGRPSIDPVVLFKMVLIQHLYGLPSLRRTADEVSLNIAYRWFLGYGLTDETPHFSTISYNFRHRFKADTIDKIFAWILSEVAQAGYLKPEAVFIDGTHIKANANTKKKIERVFADAKEKHAMRYTPYTGLAQVTNWVRLKYATMNLKKLAKWKWKVNNTPSKLLDFIVILIKKRRRTRSLLDANLGSSTV